MTQPTEPFKPISHDGGGGLRVGGGGVGGEEDWKTKLGEQSVII